MAEKMPVDMSLPPTNSLHALAILDFQMGDEWAGLTKEYANEHEGAAIQLLESEGLVGSLPERYRKWIHDWMWQDDEQCAAINRVD